MNLLIKRSLKLYFRDRSAVFFSLLAVFIIIALYAVFLGDVWLPESMRKLQRVDYLMNSWLVSGLLAVASVTTTMGAFGIMIEDKTKKINLDFYASPVKRSVFTGGYLGGVILIGIIMSLVTFVLAQIYIVLKGGVIVAPITALKVILLILLTTVANTSLMCFVATFFNSQNAFGTAQTVIGTLIGFLTGIYLPIGSLPNSVQTIIKLFPASHAAALFRQVLMEEPMKLSFTGGAVPYLNVFKEHMGVVYSIGGQEISPFISIWILAGTAIIFYALSVWRLSKNASKQNGIFLPRLRKASPEHNLK